MYLSPRKLYHSNSDIANHKIYTQLYSDIILNSKNKKDIPDYRDLTKKYIGLKTSD